MLLYVFLIHTIIPGTFTARDLQFSTWPHDSILRLPLVILSLALYTDQSLVPHSQAGKCW